MFCLWEQAYEYVVNRSSILSDIGTDMQLPEFFHPFVMSSRGRLFKRLLSLSRVRHDPCRSCPPRRATMAVAAELSIPRPSSAE
jgi:hypothetical protein